jgi:hypothetical protein
MCGGHRRKPPSEDNNEEEDDSASAGGTPASGDSGSSQAFMLSSLRPSAGKFVLGPPVDTEPPVVVFTGPADHPDAVQSTEGKPGKKKHVAKHAKTANKPAKPKVSAAAQ